MMRDLQFGKQPRRFGVVAAALMFWICAPSSARADERLQELLARAGEQSVAFVEQFSNVKCTEQVIQEKLNKDGKVELKEESSYDYLVILTNTEGELSLDESRLALKEAKADKKNRPLLVTNGFSTLFLVFHPFYANSFDFTLQGDEMQNGRLVTKIAFQHIRGMRSVAALALRGREYPLEISGTAWLDAQTGAVTRIVASVEDTMEDVGFKTLRAETQFAPVAFQGAKHTYWFPAEARVEVETPRQHWRNTHRFADYKRFSVSTEEQVVTK